MKYSFDRIKVLITSGCNSNCTHCFRCKEKNTEYISLYKLKEIVDFGIQNNCHRFGFSGGEFFTHPDCYELINYCLKKQVEIKILTNALQIEENFFKEIPKKDLISFQVSIDGLEVSHDNRRGKGSFKTTMENVQMLYSLGYKLSAKIVLDIQNYKDFPSVLEMPWFQNVLVLPMAFYGVDNTGIDKNEYAEYENVIQLIYKRMISLSRAGNVCNGYPKEIAIKYNGNVYPCTEAREHNEFLIGNINNKTLDVVLQEYEESDRERLKCKDVIIEECDVCRYKDVCNKGCRLRALRFSGDFFKPDPFNCRIFKDKFSEIPIGKLMWGDND